MSQMTKRDAEACLAKAFFPAKPFVRAVKFRGSWRFEVRVRRSRFCSDVAIGSSLCGVVTDAVKKAVR